MFIQTLPESIAQASDRWGLSNVQPVPNLSYNFVAFAKQRPSPFGTCARKGRGQGEGNVVLKIGVPDRELKSEMAALLFFNGSGACGLIEKDEEKCFLLLERLKPGEMLSTIEDDDEATHIAAQVMQNLWRPLPEHSAQGGVPREASQWDAAGDGGSSIVSKFIQLSEWFDGLKKIRPHFGGGTGPFPKPLLERVESILPELFVDTNVKLLHGDFHHFNILSSERGWLAIDPKGVIGPAGYEIGPFMLNPLNSFSDWSRFKARAERRAGIFSERLGWEREKILQWATAHAVLSAWWSLEDDTGWQYALQCAELFSEIK